MTTAIAHLVRNTNIISLRSFLGDRLANTDEAIDWQAANSDVLRPVLTAVENLSEEERARLLHDAERIGKMTEEVAATALMSVAPPEARTTLRDLESRHDRALWMFIHHPQIFRRAEDTCFFETSRRGRSWDGFLAPAELQVATDDESLSALAENVRHIFDEGRQIKAEIFQRTRPGEEGAEIDVVQVTVFREGLQDAYLSFDGDELQRQLRYPVHELAFTYAPATGVLELVGAPKAKRAELACIFAEALLGQQIDAERVPLRQFDLSVFRQRREFPTDPEDNIEAVWLQKIQFQHLSTGARITVDRFSAEEDIHSAAYSMVGGGSPFEGGFRILSAELKVKFRGDFENPRGKTLAITLRDPNGCNLKEQTQKERLIGDKYLERWGIVSTIQAVVGD